MRIKAKGQLRFRIFLVVTLLASIALTYTVFASAKRAGDEATQRSFDELTSKTKRLAADIANTIQTDGVILTAMADLLANQDLSNYRNPIVLEIMNSFNLDKTFIEDLQLLMPDGMMLRRNGVWHNVSGLIDFETEANMGAYISDRTESFFAPGEYIMCSAAPVVRDGEVAAMLYGVVRLQTVSRIYKPDAYDGRAFTLIVDGNTGDILLDTWHNKLGNISELGGRKSLKGKGFEQAVEGIHDGGSGDMAFISQSTGKILYAERGYEVGDLMLRFVAESLMEQFPKGSLCRVGGDEFVVFPAPAEGQTCEDRMRSASASITAQGYSISYGIAAHESVVGLRELVREADEKMLESKRAYYAEHDRKVRK